MTRSHMCSYPQVLYYIQLYNNHDYSCIVSFIIVSVKILQRKNFAVDKQKHHST